MNRSRALPAPPRGIARLPVDHRGYPIPWFVAYLDGRPDFRVIDPANLASALKHQRCWICGGSLSTWKTFVLGPRCVLQAISGEPPNHDECAAYAARVCPFLALPHSMRREANLPEAITVNTMMVKENPGITALWRARRYRVGRNADGSLLLHIAGNPESLVWYTEGRPATLAESRSALELARADLAARGLFEPRVLAENLERAMQWTQTP
jgi:hypothetical protein